MTNRGTSRKGPATSPSLLIRVQDPTDVDSWTTFESIYKPLIIAFCRSKGFQENDIDDVAQEVMIAVADGIQSFEYRPERGRFRSWLATITANKMTDFIRKKSRQSPQLVDAVQAFATTPDSPDWATLFVQRIFKAACERVRTEFEDRTWHCFEATWIKHVAPQAVADDLKIPIHSVYVNKSRVLKRIEAEIALLSDDMPSIHN